MDDNILHSLSNILTLIGQLMKQIQDLQDLIAGQQALICQLQKDIEALAQNKLSIQQVFVLKKPHTLKSAPEVYKPNTSAIFWLPLIADFAAKGALN